MFGKNLKRIIFDPSLQSVDVFGEFYLQHAENAYIEICGLGLFECSAAA